MGRLTGLIMNMAVEQPQGEASSGSSSGSNNGEDAANGVGAREELVEESE